MHVSRVSQLPSYEDRYPGHTDTGYAVTNESLDAHAEVLKGTKVRRVAAIASGGELIFRFFLPKAREVVGVDHSYRSLNVTYMKALLLNKLGPKATKALIAMGQKPLHDECVKLAGLIPESLRGKVTWSDSPISNYDIGCLQRAWALIPEAALKAACKKLHCLTLVHGDMTEDIAGEFDLFYISNALQHYNRNRSKPLVEKLLPKVKVGGYVLSTSEEQSAWNTADGSKQETTLHETLKERAQCFRQDSFGWTHRLYQKES